MMGKFIVKAFVLFMINVIMQYFLHEAIGSATKAMHTARLNGVNVDSQDELLLKADTYEKFAEEYF